jgi:predicted nucleic acid-binding protein
VALVLDTGVLYAALDAADRDHSACARLIETADEQLIVPAAVLVELDYFVRKFASADAWLVFTEDVHAGAYAVYPLDPPTLLMAARIQSKYADLPLGLVDASVFAVCQALGEPKVATLDRRHFGILRTEDDHVLEVLPTIGD